MSSLCAVEVVSVLLLVDEKVFGEFEKGTKADLVDGIELLWEGEWDGRLLLEVNDGLEESKVLFRDISY